MPFRAALLALLVLLVAAAPADGADGWRWPVAGQVLTAYRNGGGPYAGGQHRGIDIASPVGTPVGAATSGTVRFAGIAGSSGRTVSVRTADGRYDVSYLHLATIDVRRGQRVDAGNRLGTVGTTGRRSAAAAHLHFGVRDAGSRHGYHDPMDFLSAPPGPGTSPKPTPVPVTHPRPVRVSPHPAPGPVRVPAPSPVRVPAGRRVRVPGPRPAVRPVLRPIGAPAPRAVPAHRPAQRRAPAPRLGPQAAPSPAPAPRRVPAPAARPEHPSPAPAGGPDLGLALACVGVLAAAACVGLSGGGKDGAGARASGAAATVRRALRPLTGGR
jgi:hypothetical protein